LADKGAMYWLALIGGIIGIIEAVIGFFWAGWLGVIGSILALIIALIIIFATLKPDAPIPFSGLVILILGILLLIFGSFLGGILVIIAGIIGLVKKE
jgi:hypothetical protein